MADSNSKGQGIIRVSVCYARPDLEILCELAISEGSTLQQAILLCDLLQKAPEIDLSTARFGIYGKHKTLETILREHDRVEIYRSLIADPKESRRRRAEKNVGKS
jgi:uncharacterized protein